MELGHGQYETNVILGSSYCSGYVDTLGRWNTGFYCPETEETTVSVFCCGNIHQKYCCTKADMRISDTDERYNNSLTLLLLSMFVIILVATTISFMFCTNVPATLWRQKEKFLHKYRARSSAAQPSPSCDQMFPTTNSTQIIVEAAELQSEDSEVPAYNILPLGSYILLPQHTPDLICETQLPPASTFPTVEDDFFSTKF